MTPRTPDPPREGGETDQRAETCGKSRKPREGCKARRIVRPTYNLTPTLDHGHEGAGRGSQLPIVDGKSPITFPYIALRNMLTELNQTATTSSVGNPASMSTWASAAWPSGYNNMDADTYAASGSNYTAQQQASHVSRQLSYPNQQTSSSAYPAGERTFSESRYTTYPGFEQRASIGAYDSKGQATYYVPAVVSSPEGMVSTSSTSSSSATAVYAPDATAITDPARGWYNAEFPTTEYASSTGHVSNVPRFILSGEPTSNTGYAPTTTDQYMASDSDAPPTAVYGASQQNDAALAPMYPLSPDSNPDDATSTWPYGEASSSSWSNVPQAPQGIVSKPS
ncbi:hypothetical protein FRB95_010088 [Tulasnella sp. JGI-2019a]|nr:hypothetical protein FRB95_010088 [Tulasnella sp. JGI-2019a]